MCFEAAASEIENGSASWLTVRSPSLSSRSICRRVASPSAWKMEFSCGVNNSTMRLNIKGVARQSTNLLNIDSRRIPSLDQPLGNAQKSDRGIVKMMSQPCQAPAATRACDQNILVRCHKAGHHAVMLDAGLLNPPPRLPGADPQIAQAARRLRAALVRCEIEPGTFFSEQE